MIEIKRAKNDIVERSAETERTGVIAKMSLSHIGVVGEPNGCALCNSGLLYWSSRTKYSVRSIKSLFIDSNRTPIRRRKFNHRIRNIVWIWPHEVHDSIPMWRPKSLSQIIIALRQRFQKEKIEMKMKSHGIRCARSNVQRGISVENIENGTKQNSIYANLRWQHRRAPNSECKCFGSIEFDTWMWVWVCVSSTVAPNKCWLDESKSHM